MLADAAGFCRSMAPWLPPFWESALFLGLCLLLLAALLHAPISFTFLLAASAWQLRRQRLAAEAAAAAALNPCASAVPSAHAVAAE